MRIKLKRYYAAWHRKDRAFLCDDALRVFFSIPARQERLTIVLSKKPHPDAYRVTYVATFSALVGEEQKRVALISPAHDALKEFGLPCYVRVEL